MNDRDFDNYLALLGGLLRLRSRQQAAIAEELRDHLVEHVAHLEARGAPHDEAVRLALAEFGDAAALAANFSHLVRARRRRLIMRCTIGTACVLVGLAIGIVALRPQESDRTQRLVAQEPPKAQGPLGVGDLAANGAKTEEAPATSNEQTRQRLAAKMEANFVETPLRDVLDFIANSAGVQYYCDQSNNQSVPTDQPISIQLKAVPAEMVLDLVCRQAGVGYRMRSGVLLISAIDNLPYEPEVRVYMVPETAVEELAMLIPAMIDVHSWRQPIVMTAGGFGANYYAAAPAPNVAVAPASMPPGMAGGAGLGGGGVNRNDGTIQVFRGALVISQTPETHQKIEKLLDDLQPVLDKKPTPQPGGTPPPAPLRSSAVDAESKQIASAVDTLIKNKSQSANGLSGEADDAIQLRRTMLDVAGRLPTAAELDEYNNSAAPDKLQRLIDKLKEENRRAVSSPKGNRPGTTSAATPSARAATPSTRGQ